MEVMEAVTRPALSISKSKKSLVRNPTSIVIG